MDIELAYLIQTSLSSICSWSGIVDVIGWQGMAGMLALIFWTSAILNIAFCIKGMVTRAEEEARDQLINEVMDEFHIKNRLARWCSAPEKKVVEPVKKLIPILHNWIETFEQDMNTFGVKENGFVVALPHIMIT